jgi:hypothetical protein
MIVAAFAVCGQASRASAQSVAGTVYYQVTYDSGEVLDLASAPETGEGIRRVVRIARLNYGDQGLRVWSTEGPALSSPNGGQTVRHELRWDGKAWVPAKLFDDSKRSGQRGSDETPDADPNAASAAALGRIIAEEAKALGERMKRLRGRIELQREAVSEARSAAREASDDEARRRADERLASAIERLRELDARLDRQTQALATMLSRTGRMGEPSGELTAAGDASEAGKAQDGAVGIVSPVAGDHVLPHRVQVWRVPGVESKKRRRYRVRMGHAEAGAFGGFYYVAYADTDGDGSPDRLVAHSPLATARRAGQWTQWRFETDHEAVFVGNAWPYADTSVPCGRYRRGTDNWTLPAQPFVSDYFGAVPYRKGWPMLSNIRVEVQVPWGRK